MAVSINWGSYLSVSLWSEPDYLALASWGVGGQGGHYGVSKENAFIRIGDLAEFRNIDEQKVRDMV